jgi:hypothetical protein
MAAERDPQLRRIERTALVTCSVVAAVAATTGGWHALLGVAGGALLVAMSWRAVRHGVDAALQMTVPNGRTRRPSIVWHVLKFFMRFGILAALAYVIMVRLRAHPGWMLAGATALVAAPAIEVFRHRAQS